MAADRSYIEQNDRERARLRKLVDTLTEDDLRSQVNAEWTVAGVLGHVAFWDTRSQWLADKLERGAPFTASDVEPDDVSWINDATRPFLHAIAPRDAARLALRVAEETDRRVAAIAPERLWPNDPTSLLNAFRAEHRREHLDQIEAARGGSRKIG
jgi:sulfite reductase beta subunit-like hemoprotein